ncbi:hypothetical protein ACIG5E_38815 [Kitasatospora sp. NPDC053057]|uniref:hypothetical protein n=1 Tax=Kitasatospora sp. NPDC053057 TaxID=3364062 RepID=UPI0037C6DE44
MGDVAGAERVRAAVLAMRGAGGVFLGEVADFFDREALQLERVVEADGRAELGQEVADAARRALLIARAFTADPMADMHG